MVGFEVPPHALVGEEYFRTPLAPVTLAVPALGPRSVSRSLKLPSYYRTTCVL